jgi:hypothetical protein
LPLQEEAFDAGSLERDDGLDDVFGSLCVRVHARNVIRAASA